MKHIALISLALVPLLAGCSSSTLDPTLASEEKPTQSVASLHIQLRKLGRRVHALNRRVKSQAKRSPYAAAAPAGDLRAIRTRLAELEAASQSREPSASATNLEQTVAGLAEQLAQLSRKVDAEANQQPQISAAVAGELSDLRTRLAELAAAQSPATSSASAQAIADLAAKLAQVSRKLDAQANKPPQVSAATSRELSALATRLDRLQAAQRTAAASTTASDLKRTVADLTAQIAQLARKVDQRERTAGSSADATKALAESLARLEAAQKKDGSELKKMRSARDKDRTLVTDYLDDLDNRIAALEKPAPAAKAPATPGSTSPSKP